MNIKTAAAQYARHWYRSPQGHWTIADNAPIELRRFVKPQTTVPADQSLICEALLSLAAGTPPSIPPLVDLLHWCAGHTEAYQLCDDVLAGRQPPKTLRTLMSAAYLAAAAAEKARVTTFIQEQLKQFEEQV